MWLSKNRMFFRDVAKAIFRQAVRAAPDRLALRLYYLRATGNPFLAIKRPRTFNEKIQYRKLFERNPRMPLLVDKIEVKGIVADSLGSEWITPTLFHGTSLPPREERHWPLPYVIKASHRSHAVLFVRKEADIDWPYIEAKCAEWIASLYGEIQGEWAYSQVMPRLLVEPYIGEEQPPPDFKFFVFGGRVRFIQVTFDRYRTYRKAFFDREWRRQNFSYNNHLPYEGEIAQPECLTSMIMAAETLAAGWPFVRADFYVIHGVPKFGELTFYPDSGTARFSPPNWNQVLGDLWPDRIPSAARGTIRQFIRHSRNHLP